MTKAAKIAVRAALAVCIALAAASCAAEKIEPARSIPGINTILVTPFTDISALHGQGQTVRSPITGGIFTTGEVAEGVAVELTSTLTAQVSAMGYTVGTFEDAEGARSLALASQKGLSERDLALEIGRKSGFDAVLAGCVYRLEERVGANYSAEKPASAAFDVALFRVADGAMLWSARFDEAQKPLSENLLEVSSFVRNRGTWVTVSKFATDALTEKLTGFPRPLSQSGKK